MNIRKIGMLLIIGVMMVVMASLVAAVDVKNGEIGGSIGDNDTKDATTIQSVDAYGGNITEINISLEKGSRYWTGFWGQVSYTLVLEGASNAGFYDWGKQTTAATAGDMVFFSADNNVAWGSIQAAISTDRENEDTTLSMTGEPDSVNNTFTSTNSVALNVDGTPIGYSTTLSVNTTDDSNNEVWETVLLTDGTDAVYTGVVRDGQNNYAGVAADFQVLVPTGSGSRTYYVYTALQ